VKACIVPRDAGEAGPALEAALIAHCRERLIKWSCPREVEFLAALRRPSGKIDYRALAAPARGEGAWLG